jgi:hypothetical protein
VWVRVVDLESFDLTPDLASVIGKARRQTNRLG